jgi:hypothetical protein
MKKFTVINIGVWVLTVVLCTVAMITNDVEPCNDVHTYQMLAVCDKATDTGALLTDTEGNQWYVEIALDEGVEYLVCVVDAGTDEVEDDEIINVWRKVGT